MRFLDTLPKPIQPDFPQNRRQFVKNMGLVGGALVFAASSTASHGSEAIKQVSDVEYNAFIKITMDNQVVVAIKHMDKGQGVTTGLTTIVAEELDAAWEQMNWEFAPADPSRYNNLFFGPFQGTGGSTSIANSWDQLRNAAASVRAVLVEAAAKKWQVPAEEIKIQNGVIQYKSKTATFSDFIVAAAQITPPEKPKLKQPQDFRLIGTTLPRKDSPEKTNGSAVYTQDIQLLGMLTALVLYPPKLKAKVKSFDASQAKKTKGVQIFAISRGIAVVADHFWQAKKARDQISVEWDFSECETRSSDELFKHYQQLASQEGSVAHSHGDAAKALNECKERVDLEFQLPYLAHATMEPMNCVVKVNDDSAELWFASQLPSADLGDIKRITGLEKININTVFAGGSFGRRASPSEYVVDAVEIAKQLKGTPVKMVWTREDDMRNGKYRPMAVHKVQAGLNDKGEFHAWKHHAVASPILRGSAFEGMIQGAVDPTVVEGIAETPYAVKNIQIQGTEVASPISTLWWRSVGHSGNAFVTESLVNYLAKLAKQDPVKFRQNLLKGQDRYLGALNLAAEKSRWGSKLRKGQGRGIAVHKAMGSWVAQVAEVTVKEDNSYKVDRVVCAIDCGIAVNPDVIRAQMEGSIGFALGSVISEQITLKNGEVQADNFGGYEPLRIQDMPEVEVHIVSSNVAPSGVGEPGVPPLAAAVTGAILDATGQLKTKLPLGRTL